MMPMIMYGTSKTDWTTKMAVPNVAAFPAIAKHLHRRHETVFLPKRPHASTDEENG
jgi:hypothetical protein